MSSNDLPVPCPFGFQSQFPSRATSPMPLGLAVPPVGPIGPVPMNVNDGRNINDPKLVQLIEENQRYHRELEYFRSMDPMQHARKAAEMALEVSLLEHRIMESNTTRDSAVQRLSSAYDSIREKAATVNSLQNELLIQERKLKDAEERVQEAVEKARTEERQRLEAEIEGLEVTVRRLNEEIRILREDKTFSDEDHLSPTEVSPASTLFSDIQDSSSFVKTMDNSANIKSVEALINDIGQLAIEPRPRSVPSLKGCEFSINSTGSFPNLHLYKPQIQGLYDQALKNAASAEPDGLVKARNSVLSVLPIPSGIPDDALKPILIPVPFTIHEFLGNATGSLKNSLTGYRVFYDKLTRWNPDREEHGYYFTPLYKCATNPRVPSAHRWEEVDPKGRMNKPTECFFHKDGKWYYAGQYVGVRLLDLSAKEWDNLDTDTASMLIKETLAGRKNTSPANQYEIGQLYSAGALKIACVGLQCVGFNVSLYRTIMEQATKCQQNGRWKSNWGAPGSDYCAGLDNGYNSSSVSSSFTFA